MLSSLVIQQFIEEHLENISIRGNHLYSMCPVCGKEANHFNINLETGLWHCFKCGQSGNFPQLVKHLTGRYISNDKLEKEYTSGLSLSKLQEIFEEKQKKPVVEIGDWTENTCEIDAEGRIPKLARKYLESRNITVNLAKELQMRVGLSGKYMSRVLIPVIERGKVLNFVARTFVNNEKRYSGPHKNEPYVNKGELLWNYDNVKPGEDLILVEGIFDAIPLLDLNIVALMGKSISHIQTDKVLDLAGSITILVDGGFVEAAKDIAEKVLGFIPIKVAEMEIGHDPGEYPDEAREAIGKAVDYYSL